MVVSRFERCPCPWASQVTEHVRGELRGAGATRFLRHLAECPDCRADVADLEGLLGDLYDEMRSPPFRRDASPAPGLEARVLSRISEEARARRALRRRWAAAAAAALVAGWVGIALAPRGDESPGAERALVEVVANRAEETAPPDSSVHALRQAQGWLLATQGPSGGWNPERWGGRVTFEVGATALVVLALSDSGSDDVTEAISRAVGFLLRSQGPDGRFGPDFVHASYNHGLAALALLRLVDDRRGDGSPSLRRALDAAVRYLVGTQLPGGGWGQWIGGRPAPSEALTVWPLEALVEARSRGWDGLEPSIRRAQRWLEHSTDPESDRTRLGGGDAGRLVATWTDERAGAVPDWRRVRSLLHGPWETKKDVHGGARPALLRDLLESQVSRGPLAGTWDPTDGWGPAGGRLQSTALGVLVLASHSRPQPARFRFDRG